MGAFTKVYWQSSSTSMGGQLLLIVAAIVALLTIEGFKQSEAPADQRDMLAASRCCAEGLELIGRWRAEIVPIDPEVDPLGSGAIGIGASPVTSVGGHLPSKQASVNPNWAAVIVRLLREAGVREGDIVAMAVSGSFPALNLAVYCAVEQVGARPVIIASASASQWGANIPDLLWIDMARRLRAAGVIESKAVAASLGGREDRGVGISEEGVDILRGALEEADVPLLEPATYEEAVAERIALYAERAGVQPIRAMVNVGGGTATTGPESIDHFFDPGLIASASPRAFAVDSVMGHFIKREIPVINLTSISTLSGRFGLPYPPAREPRIGEGGVYNATFYRRWLAAILLVSLIGLTYFVTRSVDFGSILGQPRKDADHVGPAV